MNNRKSSRGLCFIALHCEDARMKWVSCFARPHMQDISPRCYEKCAQCLPQFCFFLSQSPRATFLSFGLPMNSDTLPGNGEFSSSLPNQYHIFDRFQSRNCTQRFSSSSLLCQQSSASQSTLLWQTPRSGGLWRQSET